MADKFAAVTVPASILQAQKRVAIHPAVATLLSEPLHNADGSWSIELEMEVPLPRDAIDQGKSSTGVYAREWVRIVFPPSFPSKAPKFFLREDFNRNHPHINPSRCGDLVNPCIYEGSLSDLLQEPKWIDGLIEQLADWLCKAASGDLMDCSGQGWEPMRCDEFTGYIVFDISLVRNYVAKTNTLGSLWLAYQYFFLDSALWYSGRINNESEAFKNTENAIRSLLKKRQSVYCKNSLALIAWGDPCKPICRYHPNDVKTIQELILQATEYGCKDGVEHRLKELISKLHFKSSVRFDIAIIFVVRRPCCIIGNVSEFEVIPYGVSFIADHEGILNLTEASVFRLSHVHKISQELLAKLAGRKPDKVNVSKKIALLGCGSLGSKIASHLARSGYGPFELFDNDLFLPHNSARHVIPNQLGSEFTLPKVWMMSDFLKQLGAEVEKSDRLLDVVEFLQNPNKKLGAGAFLIIDTTANNSVREALCDAHSQQIGAPLLQASLYEKGNIGFFALEGKDRNPRIDDLTVQLYQIGVDDPAIRKLLYSGSGRFDMVGTGQGCSSNTLAISDARISLFASGIAERISQYIDGEVPRCGELLIGVVDQLGISVAWKKYDVCQVRVAECKFDGMIWEVRIPYSIELLMMELMEQERPCETGGGLIGSINFGRRTVYVSGLLPPPDDSSSSPSKFVLGTKGLLRKVRRIEEDSKHMITYLGTWHSHPNGGNASLIDKKTLRQILKERNNVPGICLICRPDGVVNVLLSD